MIYDNLTVKEIKKLLRESKYPKCITTNELEL